jgi:hypothetical protein
LADADLTAEILEAEVVVKHRRWSHLRFPILSKGTVSLHGVRIEVNPDAKRRANGYVIDARKAATKALDRSRI